ncbi:hypothetical protein PFFVO_05442 [Plasmodium falciparum Vietnam Oak-Knoll (FVO)]|uniref:Uncharacterized protein n=1 Tax=Plasmodium falciparum Vietnam Oak-Knoll (FVO) TaxID=1036723 RepID=A0A024UZJ1_PLAFA|nr:hypothetical protein PFFVO_05442 [Plasmodium falciparum Vietnam Oak-Knoll (FVO)]
MYIFYIIINSLKTIAIIIIDYTEKAFYNIFYEKLYLYLTKIIKIAVYIYIYIYIYTYIYIHL